MKVRFWILLLLFSVLTLPAQAANDTPAVDIFFEANTLTPTFYQGRSEPTVGSLVKAVAILSGVPEGAYSYLWTSDQRNISSGAGLDLNTVMIPIPFSDEPVVTVNVFDGDGNLVARHSELLEISEPQVIFYEDNPLRGVSRMSITDNYIMSGEEVTFRAEPYFMSEDVFASRPRLEWSLDGQKTTSANENPQNITLLRSTPGSGRTKVEFYLHNTKNLIQYAQNGFMVNY